LRTGASSLAETLLDIAVHLLDAAPQLFEPVYDFLDPTGELAHLGFEPIHAELCIDHCAAVRRVCRSAAIYVPLQHVQIAFEPVEAFIWRTLLTPGRGRRESQAEGKRQTSAQP
jgi:hypothetical protein